MRLYIYTPLVLFFFFLVIAIFIIMINIKPDGPLIILLTLVMFAIGIETALQQRAGEEKNVVNLHETGKQNKFGQNQPTILILPVNESNCNFYLSIY